MPQRSLAKEPEATQMVLTSLPHRNQQLFSDHYLDITLPERSDWKALAAEAQPVFLDLQKLFARYTPNDKEVQLEEDFIVVPKVKTVSDQNEDRTQLFEKL